MPALEALGYELRVREPSWHQHRCLQLASPRVNLHVFGPDCPRQSVIACSATGCAAARGSAAVCTGQAGRGQRYAGHDAVQPAQAGHSARHLRPRVPRGRLHRLNARPSRQEPCMSTQSAAAAPGRRSRPRSIRRAGSAASFSLVVGDGAARRRAPTDARLRVGRRKMGPCTWSLPDGGAPWRMGSRTADAAAGAAGVVTCADYERAVPARWALSFRRALGAGFRCLAQHRTLACCVRREGCFPGEAWEKPRAWFSDPLHELLA